LCFVGIYFYENDVAKGFLTAVLGAILKHVYGPVLGVLLIGIFFRYGFPITKMFNYGLYRILARLSFSVYMVHVTIGSFFITAQKYPLEVNNATLGTYFGAVYLVR
jgi:peptidoglycan/LPS O-acetylase OafA/YrhL